MQDLTGAKPKDSPGSPRPEAPIKKHPFRQPTEAPPYTSLFAKGGLRGIQTKATPLPRKPISTRISDQNTAKTAYPCGFPASPVLAFAHINREYLLGESL